MSMNVTTLRKNIYRIVDRILETGKPEIIERKGRRIQLLPLDDTDKLSRLAGKKRRKAYVGNSDEIIGMDWSREWQDEPT